MKYAVIFVAIVCLALVLPHTEALPTTTVGQSPTRVTVKASNDSSGDKSGEDSNEDNDDATSPHPRPPPPGVSGMPTGISGQI
ncbi:unnamed protein product [Cylicocyclus nassatus]|uniref:Secreted protein n=1 Tax=Cylicocyclus nassatus TaxID=53992 RepID=A0AA36H142_CYLNA|nr:unnamed protein product [Cylicocyclus nassatus]